MRIKSGRMSHFWRTQGSYVFDVGLKGSPWIQLVPWQMKRWNHALWNVSHRIYTCSHMVSHMVTLQLGKLERIFLIKIMCCFISVWGKIVLICHDIYVLPYWHCISYVIQLSSACHASGASFLMRLRRERNICHSWRLGLMVAKSKFHLCAHFLSVNYEMRTMRWPLVKV